MKTLKDFIIESSNATFVPVNPEDFKSDKLEYFDVYIQSSLDDISKLCDCQPVERKNGYQFNLKMTLNGKDYDFYLYLRDRNVKNNELTNFDIFAKSKMDAFEISDQINRTLKYK